MPNCKSVYDPREDSTLLEKYVRKYAKGSVLDVGTGSGIQAITASYNEKVSSILALDIQKEVIEHCKKNIKNKKIIFLVSDLFENIKNKKFDTIIFNPPYLPDELKVKDLTIEGGKKGYEVLERFLNQVNGFLRPDGIILILFSSLTKKAKVEEFIKNNLLESELLEKKNYFFEELYVYKLKKTALLKKLENKKIKEIGYFAKGKRGLIFLGIYKNKKAAIKIKNPKSKAVSRIENEAKFLELLNKKSIGPKLLLYDKEFLIYEFVDGTLFTEFLESKKGDKKTILEVIKKIMEQLSIMDKLKINKEEMSHPQKHIIINNKNSPVLLDFERCHYVKSPSNVTQFCDFLISKKISGLLKNRKIKVDSKSVIKLAKDYKKAQNIKKIKAILEIIK